VESPIVVEKKKEKKKGRGSLLLFLMAVGLWAIALTSITLLSPVAFYGLVDSPASSIDENGGSRGDGSAVIPTALAASAAAVDGEGTAIEANSLTKSGEMTITGYSDSRFSTELSCSIDTLPTYWSGSPVTLSGLLVGNMYSLFRIHGWRNNSSVIQLGDIGVTGSTSKQGSKKVDIRRRNKDKAASSKFHIFLSIVSLSIYTAKLEPEGVL
jgi:hypothetical protein